MTGPGAAGERVRRVRRLRHREDDWAGLRVLVAGLGVSGCAAAEVLVRRGARVVAVDSRAAAGDADLAERAHLLGVLGAEVRLGAGQEPGADAPPSGRWDDVDLLVTSPGWRPDHPLLAGAAAAGVPVWGEVELAWRLRPAGDRTPWLTLTGTNGKTTTVQMLEAILVADGRRAVAAGNVGVPLVHVVLDPQPYDALAVELSSFQLHWLDPDPTHSLHPLASACLNIAPDHVDWHGSIEAYARDKGRVYLNTQVARVFNAADPRTERLVRDAPGAEGCRTVGFTLGVPAVGMLGVVDGVLLDRAFVGGRGAAAVDLAALEDLSGLGGGGPPAPHTVANALAAAALARAAGVSPAAVRSALRGFRAGDHRVQHVADVAGVRWVDDSKATNPHAAAASLAAFEHVVWIAGGLAKGATYDDLVVQQAHRLRGVVLIGADRGLLARALARHAPEVPVVEVSGNETGPVMDAVVAQAGRLARPGDVVLLAPAAASMDMFRSYADRGQQFAAAVRRLGAGG